jgi:hypothetical protein
MPKSASASTRLKAADGERGTQLSPRPAPIAAPLPVISEGHVGICFGSRGRLRSRGRGRRPRAVAGEKSGCGIRRSAAHASGDWQCASDLKMHSLR